jgi:catechol 2,3-dioxygenase-like lactoylglutathione lyase family enzyme
MITARYVHTNLIARDWRSLAAFYKNVFGCTPAGPERDLSGPAMEAATALKGAHLRGAHLRLPGHSGNGPTLEIFQYEPAEPGLPPQINRPGFGHIAFQVGDVAAARTAVLAAGGRDYGQTVSVPVPGAGTVTFVYVCDPEGNVIELQSWM